MKVSTLCFLVKEGQILLAMKKHGFGVGKWNGVGGKVKLGETVETAVLRELKEEIGVDGEEKYLESRGILRFRSENSDLDWNTHVYFLSNWQGEPTESEEMKPQWHDNNQLPFDNMWVDDKHWLPLVLDGQKLDAEFFFDSTGSKIIDMQIKQI
ncbi:MAG: NUDIX hydrolase [Parcubacteria group bacterium GW2011_GWF2_44_8b]|nr:MAG: NUDIX hydrolase [Parcubacteria group bacterium GW2011_GWC1_43_30]KKT80632.1 MAG: NUDIX hydrolase [Parcubacteria group bacterium GW2011_GWF2_44_8b]